MKKNKLSLCFAALLILGINFQGISQDTLHIYKNEIGFGISDIIYGFGISTTNMPKMPVLNVSYKRVYNKNVFRSGISFRHFNDRQYTGSDQLFTYFLANAGYERRFFDKKFQLLTGIDLVYNYKSDIDKSEFGYRASTYQIGLGPVVGLIYKPTKRISLQTEFGLFYGPEKEKITGGGKSTWVNNGSCLSTQRNMSFHIFYNF